MGSYLTDLPSKVIGSLGIDKIMTGLTGDRTRKVLPDEWNKLRDYLILACATVGITGSTDENSHEHRLDELAKLAGIGPGRYGGYFEDFVDCSLVGNSKFVDDLGAAGGVNNAIANAVGVGWIVAAAGVETGWGGVDGVFDMQDTLVKIRHRISALPVGGADILRIGLWNGANDWCLFHCTDPTNPNPWTVEVMSGGVSQGSVVLTAAPVAGAWHTFKIATTATGVTFTYDEGVEEETIACVPPAVQADPRTTVTSAAGGENHYTDYIAAFGRTSY